MSFGSGSDPASIAKRLMDEDQKKREDEALVDQFRQSLSTPSDTDRIVEAINDLDQSVQVMNENIVEMNQNIKKILTLLERK